MPSIIETVVYSFDELDDDAKEKARSWYREGNLDYEWWDSVYDDFRRIAEIMGVEVDDTYFSGFWSQGDGACFTGSYAYAKQAPLKIRAYAPKDEELHRIADQLQEVQKRNFYQLSASISHQGRYYHEGSMRISVDEARTSDAEDLVIDALRDLARWLYRSLEQEYDWLQSDEQVDEAIMDNEYTFTSEGRRCG